MTDAPFHRLHPLSPLLRGGRAVGAVIAAVSVRTLLTVGWVRALEGIAVVVVLALLVAYIGWRYSGYRIQGTTLHIQEGVLFRRSRHLPLERIQAVDVVRPLLARVLGLAELKIEVVGSGKTEAPLSFLTESQAHALRDRLLALAAGVDEDEPAPPEQVLATVPPRQLVLSLLLLAPVAITLPIVLVLCAVFAAVNVAAFLGSLGALGSLVLVIGRVAGARLIGEYGFTVAESPDGLRIRRGLLQTTAQTIPPGRVQAIRMVSPLLWRRRNWVRVEVDVAGYRSSGGNDDSSGVLLPVADRDLALAVIHRVLPGLEYDRTELVPVPRRARWFAPIGRKVLAVGEHNGMVIVASGRFRRQVEFSPLARAQSIRTEQGPLQRRLRLATVHVDTAGRRIAITAPHRDAADADALLAHLVEVARRERERRRKQPRQAEPSAADSGSADDAGDVRE